MVDPDVSRFFVATRTADGVLEVRVHPRSLRNAALYWGFIFFGSLIILIGWISWPEARRLFPSSLISIFAALLMFDLWYLRTALAGDAVWLARKGELSYVFQGLRGESRTTIDGGTLVLRGFLSRSDLFVEGHGRKLAPWRPLFAATLLARTPHLRKLARVLADETGFPLEERGWGF